MKREPDICTSSRCNEYGCDYCIECSHAIFKGKSRINGRWYYWEFNPYNGPLFSCPSIGKKDWCPHERHEAWARFTRWWKRLKKSNG